MTIPSERVHDTFRRRSFGKVEANDNTKSATDSFHLDHARLGVHQEYDETAKNDWGGTGRMVDVENDIRLNAIAAMGDLRAKASYRSVDAPTNETGTGPCCIPTPFPPNGINPMYRRRRG